jgi:hypothetical protein
VKRNFGGSSAKFVSICCRTAAVRRAARQLKPWIAPDQDHTDRRVTSYPASESMAMFYICTTPIRICQDSGPVAVAW